MTPFKTRNVREGVTVKVPLVVACEICVFLFLRFVENSKRFSLMLPHSRHGNYVTLFFFFFKLGDVGPTLGRKVGKKSQPFNEYTKEERLRLT